MFPFLVVVSISLREGNFSTGSLLPDRPTLEHWYLAFGQPFTRADGTVVQPPYPVMWWMFNSVKIAMIASVGIVIISTISAYAFSRVKFRGPIGVARHAVHHPDLSDDPGADRASTRSSTGWAM